VFLPTTWKLNDELIEILEKEGFEFSEMQERPVLLSNNEFKKIKASKVFNWDSAGYPEKKYHKHKTR
jgi:hypothetical protein